MPMQAQMGGGSIVPTHSQPSTGTNGVISTMLRPPYFRERYGTPCTGLCLGLIAGLQGTENLASTGFDLRTVQPVASRSILVCLENCNYEMGTGGCLSKTLKQST
jgi:tetrahydromethanopterin S-methyltransferase subunit E